MNRINQLLNNKKENILSVYFTAGYPELENTETIIVELEKAGVDLIEIGIPFSDPLADGPVIQQSSEKALANGITLSKIFEQLKNIRSKVSIPLILMGYLNPVMQYGIENFCRMAAQSGIDGTILPDLPLDIYEKEYKELFRANGLSNILLITPQTAIERLKIIDKATDSFIYMVSSASTTGTKGISSDILQTFTEKIHKAGVQSPRLIGFGISDKESFQNACRFANGAIIGTAFIKALSKKGDIKENIHQFVNKIIES
ncbi:MAG: tryptophan synthase subunit alpha [Bacteroidales bacterium]|nr:tryptophan synthase subunit alpha [Bacteroidales bacterium]